MVRGRHWEGSKHGRSGLRLLRCQPHMRAEIPCNGNSSSCFAHPPHTLHVLHLLPTTSYQPIHRAARNTRSRACSPATHVSTSLTSCAAMPLSAVLRNDLMAACRGEMAQQGEEGL